MWLFLRLANHKVDVNNEMPALQNNYAILIPSYGLQNIQ